MTQRTLLTVRQFAEKHPAFSQGSLRNLIFNAQPRVTRKAAIPGNGFDVCLVRMGRKILIDEDKFFAWLDGRNGKAA
jgi:hypothetical protein